MSPTI